MSEGTHDYEYILSKRYWKIVHVLVYIKYQVKRRLNKFYLCPVLKQKKYSSHKKKNNSLSKRRPKALSSYMVISVMIIILIKQLKNF